MLVFAHRGASAERPEHTRAAYDLAIEQGADFIEPDLVLSRDGVLVVRHDVEIGQTTNVADYPEFANRRRVLSVDGRPVEGWFACDFTWPELQTLHCRERLPDLRPGNAAWSDEPILRFEDVVEIARTGGVGLIPELKHPAFHAEQGSDIMDAWRAATEPFPLGGGRVGVGVKAVEADGSDSASSADGVTPNPGHSPIKGKRRTILQCFEVGPLKQLPCVTMQLIAATGGPADQPHLTPADMVTPHGLAAIASYAAWIGVEASLIIPTLVADAHAAGLKVAAWTIRPENHFLPPTFRRGNDPAAWGDQAGWAAALENLGVDAVFTDAPGAAQPATTSSSGTKT